MALYDRYLQYRRLLDPPTDDPTDPTRPADVDPPAGQGLDAVFGAGTDAVAAALGPPPLRTARRPTSILYDEDTLEQRMQAAEDVGELGIIRARLPEYQPRAAMDLAALEPFRRARLAASEQARAEMVQAVQEQARERARMHVLNNFGADILQLVSGGDVQIRRPDGREGALAARYAAREMEAQARGANATERADSDYNRETERINAERSDVAAAAARDAQQRQLDAAYAANRATATTNADQIDFQNAQAERAGTVEAITQGRAVRVEERNEAQRQIDNYYRARADARAERADARAAASEARAARAERAGLTPAHDGRQFIEIRRDLGEVEAEIGRREAAGRAIPASLFNERQSLQDEMREYRRAAERGLGETGLVKSGPDDKSYSLSPGGVSVQRGAAVIYSQDGPQAARDYVRSMIGRGITRDDALAIGRTLSGR